MGDRSDSTPGSMAIENYRKQETALQEFKVPQTKAKKKAKPKILSEEKYIEELGKIIQRDFFPDLEKLKAQNDYLDAESRNDFIRMAAIKAKYTRSHTDRSLSMSPASFETPSCLSNAEGSDTPCSNISSVSKTSTSSKKSLGDVHSLDSFLQKYTSEDNESFEQIIQTAEEKLHQKFIVLYNQERLSAEQLAKALTLPSIEKQFDQPDPNRAIETWNYTNKNSVMYIPDGVELTREEQVEAAAKKKTIHHKATRLSANPFNDASRRKAVNDIAETHSQALSEKIGADGLLLSNNQSTIPQIKGYDLLATPSPKPGEDFTPLMTWGEIEGTPFLLDGSDTPRITNSGPSFHINENSRRETIAHQLAEKAGEKQRAQKQKALDAARKNMSSPFIRSNMERLASMSPAARRLASAKLGLRSPSLLTPTPRNLKSCASSRSSSSVPRTPGSSSSAKINSSLGILIKTPTQPSLRTTSDNISDSVSRKRSSEVQAKATPTPSTSVPTSTITDDILKIPSKRMRAIDFF